LEQGIVRWFCEMFRRDRRRMAARRATGHGGWQIHDHRRDVFEFQAAADCRECVDAEYYSDALSGMGEKSWEV